MSALISLGSRAMGAAYAQLQTTSNNISNSGVAGYSRQEVKLATADGQYTGAGFFGKGVDVVTVTRAHDDFLTNQVAVKTSQASADSTRLEQLTKLEAIFPIGENGIGSAAGALLNAFGDVASAPSDSSARQVVLSDAEEVASRFQDAATQLDAVQAGVTADLKTSIASVNTITKNIAKLNLQISSAKGLGQPPNDLLDQRDQLVQQLSGLVQVTTVPADDDSLGVFIAGGQQLVLGSSATQLLAVQDSFDPAQYHIGVSDGPKPRVLADDALGGGSIAGLMTFQSKDLRDGRNLLGQLASTFSSMMNQQQALGLDQSKPATSGAAMFSVATPRTLPSAGNAKDASGNFISSVGISVTDATALQPSDYQLQPDPSSAGSYLVTRLSDGKQTSVVNGDTLDGFQINIGSPAPGAGERFLLQPVGNAAASFQRVLSDPKGIAAASPVTASFGVNNTGTATLGALSAASPTLDKTATVNLSFTDNNGGYSWQQLDSSGAVVSSGSATWTAGTPISLNGFSLQLDGVPKSGDTIAVKPTADPSSNNGNALAFIDLSNKIVANGESITGAYASAMSNIGVRVQAATTASGISSAAQSQAVTAQANKSGVNLDEEAARLIQYQQAYQASAKILQVAQTVFDTLLQMTAH